MGSAASNAVLLPCALLCIVASAERCSSLDGPFCSFLNGKDPAFHKQMQERMLPTKLEAENPTTEKGQHGAGKTISTSGSFTVSGNLDPETGELTLMPGEWIEQPLNWVTIGLVGRGVGVNGCGCRGLKGSQVHALPDVCVRNVGWRLTSACIS